MMDSNPLMNPPNGFQQAPADPQIVAAGIRATFRVLDLSAVHGKPELMRQLAADLTLPTHFGLNWDALYDLLADPEIMRPTVICIGGWTDFQARHRELAGQLKSVMIDAQDALAAAKIPLWVLI